MGIRVIEFPLKGQRGAGREPRRRQPRTLKLSGVVAVKADFTDAVMKDCKLVRANLRQATLKGADLAGADLAGADVSGADLRDAVLVGAKTTGWTFGRGRHGRRPDRPAGGRPVETLPFDEMLRAHALWCETSGAQGTPSSFNGADLRGLKSIRGLNLTALSAQRRHPLRPRHGGRPIAGRVPAGGGPARLQPAPGGPARRAAEARQALGADLREAQLGPLVITHDRILPVDMTEAVLRNADLSGADLRHACLKRADLTRARFLGAQVRHADLLTAVRHGVVGLDGL